MKVTPLAQGTGVPAQSEGSTGKSVDSSTRARAIAVASGQTPAQPVTEVSQPQSGDPQVDRIKRIKMKTQQSTNRHDVIRTGEEVDPNTVIAPNVAESPIPDTKEPVIGTEETKPIDPQVAAIIKAKRALQIERAKLEQDKLEAQKSSFNPEEYVSKADLQANPLKVFEAGVSYDQLTEAILNNQSAPIDPVKLRNEIKEDLKKELLGEFSTRDTQAEQQVLADYSRQVNQLTAEGEKYEAIRHEKAQKQVVDLIHRTWKSTGEVLDVQDAADLVENQLIDEALPFAKIKKVQSRLTPQQEAVIEQIVQQPKPNTRVMRTLTNRDNASPIMDRRARAIAAMNGTLKKG